MLGGVPRRVRGEKSVQFSKAKMCFQCFQFFQSMPRWLAWSGPSFHEGQRVLGPDEGLAGEYDDQQGEGSFILALLRLLEGRDCQPRGPSLHLTLATALWLIDPCSPVAIPRFSLFC